MNTEEMNALIEIVKQIAGSECQRIMKTANVASNHFGTILSINADKTCNVLLAGGEIPYTNLVNKTGETLDVGDVVLIEALNGNIGNGYIKLRQGKSDISGAPDTIAWSKVYDAPSTLGGYGIQDAKIENGTITLGLNSIKPLTEDSSFVQSINDKTGVVTLEASDVNALPSSTQYVSSVDGVSGEVTTNGVKYTTQSLTNAQKSQARVNIGAGTSNFDGDYNSLANKPTIPTKTSQITNDSNYVADANYVHTDNNFTNALKTQITTNEDNIAMAESDIDSLQTDVGTLKTDMTTVKGAVTTLQDTYVPNTTKINNKALNSDITLTASDINALPLTGGTLTGNLKVGSSSIGTNGYITGTWLQGTAENHLTTKATKIAVQDINGWVYHRTPTEILSDIGAMPNQAATATTLGGVKVGTGLAIDDSGVLSATGGGVADSVDWSNVQNKPTTIAGYGITDAVTSVNGKSGNVTIEANTVTYKINKPTVEVGNWVANTNTQADEQERADYPYMATISVTNPAVTSSDIARVMFNYSEQSSGNFALSCYTVTNGVIIEAKEKPATAITLNYIYIERTVS